MQIQLHYQILPILCLEYLHHQLNLMIPTISLKGKINHLCLKPWIQTFHQPNLVLTFHHSLKIPSHNLWSIPQPINPSSPKLNCHSYPLVELLHNPHPCQLVFHLTSHLQLVLPSPLVEYLAKPKHILHPCLNSPPECRQEDLAAKYSQTLAPLPLLIALSLYSH